MADLDVQPTATAQWRSLVQRAGRACDTHLDEPIEAYLVFMLMRFSDRTGVGGRALALEFLQALQQSVQSAAPQLRDTGDECLLVCGLFPQRARRRRVSFRYYVALGRGAYDTLARHGRDSNAEPFPALARGFVRVMEVLQAMRHRDAANALSPLDAAEMALETGGEAAWSRARPANATLLPGGRRHH